MKYDLFEDKVSKLMDVLGEETLTGKEITLSLGLKHMPEFRNNYLYPAIEKGLVEMPLPDKPRSGNQRYRKVSSVILSYNTKSSFIPKD